MTTQEAPRYVPMARRLTMQVVAYCPILNDDNVRRRAQVREGMQPYFDEGWLSLELGRDFHDTTAINDAAIEFGLADRHGRVVGTFPTYAKALAAQPAYQAKQDEPIQYQFAKVTPKATS